MNLRPILGTWSLEHTAVLKLRGSVVSLGGAGVAYSHLSKSRNLSSVFSSRKWAPDAPASLPLRVKAKIQ